MALYLSATELSQLQAALQILLSPLAFESIGAWRLDARQRVATLLHADTAISFLPLKGEVPFLSNREVALTQYLEHYHRFDHISDYRPTQAFTFGSLQSRWDRDRREGWPRGEFFNEWVRPQALNQPCGMVVERPAAELPCPGFGQWAGLAGLWFYWDAEEVRRDEERELEILRLLLPAFEAGLHVVVRASQAGDFMANLFDELAEGIWLLDPAEHVLYENPNMAALLRDEPEACRVRNECFAAGRLVLSLVARQRSKTSPTDRFGAAGHEVRTGGARYRIRANLVAPGLCGPTPLAVILLQRVPSSAFRPDTLRHRYGLTPREVQVLHLIAAGHSNAQVAKQLGFSIHTARRHVEHVISKLGVHTRTAAAAKLRGF